jgi:hypothetical protein
MSEQDNTFDAAEKIDALLDGDDGALLAAMARYKANILELFGRDGIVEILREAIDNAAHVEYFSRRSRKEIDPLRPEVNLKVDHLKAVADKCESVSRFAGTSSWESDEKDLTALKAAIIYDEVCRPMATKMNEALAPHWAKAKTYMTDKKIVKNPKDLIMLLSTLFSVRVGTDSNVAPNDRICSLIVFI